MQQTTDDSGDSKRIVIVSSDDAPLRDFGCMPASIEDEANVLDGEIRGRVNGGNGHDHEALTAPAHFDEVPPIEFYIRSAQVGIDDLDDHSRPADGRSSVVDFATLAQTKAPEFRWFVPGWLSPHPTLMSGKGGMGKSLAALQMAVALAAGKTFLGRAVDPLRVCLWSCEEDIHELHRRLERICAFYGIGLCDLSSNLLIDCRHGLDNTLLGQEYGRPVWTPLCGYLREQVNDHRAEVWIGDNIAHMYACSENDRHPVTLFTSWLSGLRGDVAWCPLLIGHVSKVGGSEYSGSTAWENAVRMRWYLGDRLPEESKGNGRDGGGADDGDGDGGAPGNVRFLCKRKTNYDQKDYVRFTMQDGLLIPEAIETGDSGLMAALRARRGVEVAVRAVGALNERGMNSSEQPGRTYLPVLAMQYGLTEGLSKAEFTAGMRRAIMDGKLRREVVGKKANRTAKEGLVVANY